MTDPISTHSTFSIESANQSDILHHISLINDKLASTTQNLQKHMYQNYPLFIRASSEITSIESSSYKLRQSLEELGSIVISLGNAASSLLSDDSGNNRPFLQTHITHPSQHTSHTLQPTLATHKKRQTLARTPYRASLSPSSNSHSVSKHHLFKSPNFKKVHLQLYLLRSLEDSLQLRNTLKSKSYILQLQREQDTLQTNLFLDPQSPKSSVDPFFTWNQGKNQNNSFSASSRVSSPSSTSESGTILLSTESSGILENAKNQLAHLYEQIIMESPIPPKEMSSIINSLNQIQQSNMSLRVLLDSSCQFRFTRKLFKLGFERNIVLAVQVLCYLAFNNFVNSIFVIQSHLSGKSTAYATFCSWAVEHILSINRIIKSHIFPHCLPQKDSSLFKNSTQDPPFDALYLVHLLSYMYREILFSLGSPVGTLFQTQFSNDLLGLCERYIGNLIISLRKSMLDENWSSRDYFMYLFHNSKSKIAVRVTSSAIFFVKIMSHFISRFTRFNIHILDKGVFSGIDRLIQFYSDEICSSLENPSQLSDRQILSQLGVLYFLYNNFLPSCYSAMHHIVASRMPNSKSSIDSNLPKELFLNLIVSLQSSLESILYLFAADKAQQIFPQFLKSVDPPDSINVVDSISPGVFEICNFIDAFASPLSLSLPSLLVSKFIDSFLEQIATLFHQLESTHLVDCAAFLSLCSSTGNLKIAETFRKYFTSNLSDPSVGPQTLELKDLKSISLKISSSIPHIYKFCCKPRRQESNSVIDEIETFQL